MQLQAAMSPTPMLMSALVTRLLLQLTLKRGVTAAALATPPEGLSACTPDAAPASLTPHTTPTGASHGRTHG